MKMKELTAEAPLLSIGLVAILLGGGSWLSWLYFKTDANAQAIDEVQRTMTINRQRRDDVLRSIDNHLSALDSRLSRIEGALSIETK